MGARRESGGWEVRRYTRAEVSEKRGGEEYKKGGMASLPSHRAARSGGWKGDFGSHVRPVRARGLSSQRRHDWDSLRLAGYEWPEPAVSSPREWRYNFNYSTAPPNAHMPAYSMNEQPQIRPH